MFVLVIVIVVVAVAHLTFVFCFVLFFVLLVCVLFGLRCKTLFPCNFRGFTLFLSQTRFLQNPSLSSLFPLFFANPFSNNYSFLVLLKGASFFCFFLIFAFFSFWRTCCCFENQRSYKLQPKAFIVFIKAFFSRMSEI